MQKFISKVEFILAVFVSLGSLSSFAVGNDPQRADHWRERCRQALSGFYMHLKDEVQHSQQSVEFQSSKAQRLRKELEDSILLQEKTSSKVDAEPFDRQLIRDAQQAKVRSRSLVEALHQTEALLEQLEVRINKAKAEFAVYEQQVMPFTDLENHSKVPGSRQRLEFKEECPPYRYVCPLPASQAQALAEIAKDHPMLVDCKKYAQIKE